MHVAYALENMHLAKILLLKLKGIEVAGKTGTAQFFRKGQKDNHTWFMCFAPYDKPKYAICVFIQGAKGGGITAAPIAAEILDESIALSEKRYDIAVKSMAPAVGSFQFIENINFKTDVGNYQSAASLIADIKPAPRTAADEAEDGGEEATEETTDKTEDGGEQRTNERTGDGMSG